jgi:hypothetical protein
VAPVRTKQQRVNNPRSGVKLAFAAQRPVIIDLPVIEVKPLPSEYYIVKEIRRGSTK